MENAKLSILDLLTCFYSYFCFLGNCRNTTTMHEHEISDVTNKYVNFHIDYEHLMFKTYTSFIDIVICTVILLMFF